MSRSQRSKDPRKWVFAGVGMQAPMARSVCLANGGVPAENLRVVSGLQKMALPDSYFYSYAYLYVAHPPGYTYAYVVAARTSCPPRPSGQPWWPPRCLPSSSARQPGGPLRLSPNLRSLSCHLCQSRGCQLPPCQRLACRRRQSGRPCTAPRAWSRVKRARRLSPRDGFLRAGVQSNCCSKGRRRAVLVGAWRGPVGRRREGMRRRHRASVPGSR